LTRDEGEAEKEVEEKLVNVHDEARMKAEE